MFAPENPTPETTCDGVLTKYHQRQPLERRVRRRRRVGARAGNTYSATHGLYIKRALLHCLPKQWEQAGRTAAELRRALEDAVEGVRGKVDVADALAINTAAKWERHGALAARWLRENPDLPLTERLEFSREIARAAERRDAAVEKLGIEQPRGNDPRTIHAALLYTPAPEAVPTPPDTPTGLLGAYAGVALGESKDASPGERGSTR